MKDVFTAVGAVVVVSAVVALIMALPVMWLWNWLCPAIFELPMIDVWQALGLIVLVRMILPTSTSKKAD